MNYILQLASIILFVVGQVLFKIGLEQIGGVNLTNAWKALFSPYIFMGLFLYVIATGVWFVILSRIPLSIAYPFQSLAYIFVMLLAWKLFHEHIGTLKWTGAVVIIIGVALISYEK